MPYIEPYMRPILDGRHAITRSGDLAYVLTKEVVNYLNTVGHSFDNYAKVLGVLEAVKLELYRRVVAPYEDRKISENGDVF